MKNDKVVMAYLAGIMDGDGSFSIIKLTKGSLNPLYTTMLQCGTWRLEFLRALKEVFGGNLVTGKLHICKDGTPGHALTTWKLRSGINCKPAIEALLPFLKIKKERAECLLQFINECPFVRGKTLDSNELVKREALYLRSINYNDWTATSTTITTKLAKVNSDDPVFWAYVAGLMDTDGSFSVKRQRQNKGTHVINARYLPIISIGMTDTRAINYIRENCNVGKFYIPRNRDTKRGVHYHFEIFTKSDCIEFLTRIMPYLRAKKLNAEVILDFCKNSKNTGYCKAGIPADELAYREECYQKLCHLNKYGVYKSSLKVLNTQTDNAEGNKEQAGDKPCSLNAVSGENLDNSEVCGTLNSSDKLER